MSAPRVLGYDDLHGYLEERIDDAMGLGAEYEEQGDVEEHSEQVGRAQAFREVLSHIEMELAVNRW